MKLSLNTDFTRFPRAVSVASAGDASGAVAGRVAMAHDERHLRRRAIELTEGSVEGGKVLVDLPEPVTLGHGDRLVLEDGRQIEIVAAPEQLHDIRARDTGHLAELAWRIGNRHLAAAFETGRILILHDHVIKAALEGLGATVTDVVEPFSPARGAHPGHDHGHHHHDDHHHEHGERDAHGRLPGDPHYGHNHA